MFTQYDICPAGA